MGRMTFVVEFEDGKEPPVHAHMEVLGGKVVTISFRDEMARLPLVDGGNSNPIPYNGMRCFICNGKHPIGVPCPLSLFTGGTIRSEQQ
ncbi:hypothetical protein ACYA5G_05365 [Klebsiella pneumoniae]|uniref:hypothetical protein n=1 Tax=Klebsiella pneumoniae TaxID=573 RepID=UPI001CF44307|nr:hypothetical protein [Klebsiella pneumoniae]MCA6701561.1 hypothetical protein [Klebsiella pneumoniae]